MRLAIAILLIAGALPVGAQEPDSGRVTYITASDVYVSGGVAATLVAGDTVLLVTTDALIVRAVVSAASADRFAAAVLDGAAALRIGEIVKVRAPSRAPAGAAEPQRAGAVVARESAPAPRRRAPASLHGHIALEVDAAESTARWGDIGEPESVWRTATPSLRLSTWAAQLPGGLSARISMRAAYPYADPAPIGPPAAVSIGALAVERRFSAVPLHVVAGRFASEYESYSTFWDGVLARVGRPDGIGAGFALGFTPTLGTRGLSTEHPKATVFADVHHFRGRFAYESDLSLHRELGAAAARTFLGVSQRLGWRGARLTQMSRIDAAEGGWRVSLIDLGLSTPVASGVRISSRYNLSEPHVDGSGDGLPGWRRERVSIGASFAGGRGAAGIEAGVLRAGGEPGSSGSAWFDLPRTRVLGLGISATMHHWSGSEASALSLAPALRRRLGGAEVRTGYVFRTTRLTGVRNTTHAGEVSLRVPIGRFEAQIGATHERGVDVSATRIRSALRLRF